MYTILVTSTMLIFFDIAQFRADVVMLIQFHGSQVNLPLPNPVQISVCRQIQDFGE